MSFLKMTRATGERLAGATLTLGGVKWVLIREKSIEINASSVLMLVTIIVCLLLILKNKFQNQKPGCNLPEAFSIPLIGNLSLFGGLPHIAVTKLSKIYGKIFHMNAGGDRNFVILNDIDMVRDAMQKFPSALTGKPQTTTTKLTNSGAQQDMGKRWTKRRHITMTAFKNIFREQPQEVQDILDQELSELVNILKNIPQEGHEPTQDITYFVARTMWRLVYGKCQSPDEKTCQELNTLAQKIDHYTQNAGPFCQLDRFPLLKKMMTSFSKYKDAVNFMTKFCESNEARREAEGGETPDGHKDLMTFMMQAAKSLNPEDNEKLGLNPELLMKGVGDLIRAGTESPSLLLIWTCLMLAKNQHVQDKMAAELNELYDKDEKMTITDASADRTPYTHAVVYETVRYCAIVPFLKRRTLSPVNIGGYDLPEGTNIIINSHAISHDVDHWGDPEVFRPERFLNTDGSFDLTRLEHFLPFGIGKRRCMGEELGKLLPFAAISTLVLNFNITAPKDQVFDLTPLFGITLTPQKHRLLFNPRINSCHDDNIS